MRKELIKQWDKNKGKLENWFQNTKQKHYDEYIKILKKILELVLIDKEYFLRGITQINNGDWQGTLIFAIPEATYQPTEDEYLFTWVDYGSCSGCDTLMGIADYKDELPNKNQVIDYMTLALHMVQHMKKLWEEE